MPSFDIVCKIDLQSLDNTLNISRRELQNRFDFKDSHYELEFNKKENKLIIEADSDMKLNQIIDILISKSIKQGLDPLAFNLGKEIYPSGKIVKKEISVKNGLQQEDAKKIVKHIKESGLKVQSAIMDTIVRVTAKKIDDLQSTINLCKKNPFGLPLQFENMKT